MTYIKDYMKSVTDYLKEKKPERAEPFQKAAQDYVKKVRSSAFFRLEHPKIHIRSSATSATTSSSSARTWTLRAWSSCAFGAMSSLS